MMARSTKPSRHVSHYLGHWAAFRSQIRSQASGSVGYVWLLETGCGAGFASEPLLECPVLGEVWEQHLQCDHPVDFGVMRAPHLAHAAAAQQLDKATTPERRALHRLTIRSQPLHRRPCRLRAYYGKGSEMTD